MSFQKGFPVTIVGNLVADPDKRLASGGVPVMSFRVAQNHRRYNAQTRQWEDDDASFVNCVAWNNRARAYTDLKRGTPVIVQGTMRQKNWQNDAGENRSTFELTVEHLGHYVYPTAGDQQQQGGQQQGNDWNNAQQGSQQANNDMWNSAPQADFGSAGEPPF